MSTKKNRSEMLVKIDRSSPVQAEVGQATQFWHSTGGNLGSQNTAHGENSAHSTGHCDLSWGAPRNRRGADSTICRGDEREEEQPNLLEARITK